MRTKRSSDESPDFEFAIGTWLHAAEALSRPPWTAGRNHAGCAAGAGPGPGDGGPVAAQELSLASSTLECCSLVAAQMDSSRSASSLVEPGSAP